MRRSLLIAVLLPCATSLAQGVDDRPTRRVEAELQNKINAALYKGITYLKGIQGGDGSWVYPRNSDGTGGLTALALYALAASGVRADDASIVRGLEWIKTHPRPFSDEARFGTYSASLLILALTRIDAGKHKRWIKGLAHKLANSQLSSGIWTYQLSGNSTGTSRGRMRVRAIRDRPGDNSNSQFAILGLWSAQVMAGYRAPRKLWKKVAAYYARTQLPDGRWSYRNPSVTSAGPRRGRPGVVRAKPSMTGAGLASYVAAVAARNGGIKGLPKARKTPVADKGLRAYIRGRSKWRWSDYYFTYGVERVGTFLAVPEVAWYVQGARFLVGAQASNGAWRRRRGGHGDPRNAYETSLALLFLSKATSYPITPREVQPRTKR